MLAKARRDKQTGWEWGWRRVGANGCPVSRGFLCSNEDVLRLRPMSTLKILNHTLYINFYLNHFAIINLFFKSTNEIKGNLG